MSRTRSNNTRYATDDPPAGRHRERMRRLREDVGSRTSRDRRPMHAARRPMQQLRKHHATAGKRAWTAAKHRGGRQRQQSSRDSAARVGVDAIGQRSRHARTITSAMWSSWIEITQAAQLRALASTTSRASAHSRGVDRRRRGLLPRHQRVRRLRGVVPQGPPHSSGCPFPRHVAAALLAGCCAMPYRLGFIQRFVDDFLIIHTMRTADTPFARVLQQTSV
jgi:hypothetical protein